MNVDALKGKPLIWVGSEAGAGTGTLVASYFAKRHVASTRYLGARVAAAALPELIRGLGAPEVFILKGCQDLGADLPLHQSLLGSVSATPLGSKVILIGRGTPPEL